MKSNPRVVIVGVGLIGGSLGLALKRKKSVECVIGVSRRETIDRALELGCIDKGFEYKELQKAVLEADILVLASPIQRIISFLCEIATFELPRGLIITDVGSTKNQIKRIAEKLLPPEVFFIGGHPMAGAETSGVDASDPFLFQNAIYVLCPSANVSEILCKEFGDFIETIGARVILLDADKHDKAVALVSHMPHLLAVSLVNFVSQDREGDCIPLQLAAGGFRDMTRIASSSFSVWRDIIETNQSVIQGALKDFGDSLVNLSGKLDLDYLQKIFDKAAMTRSGIPRDTKGFLTPLSELLIVVEDKPGVIVNIALPLAEAGINIQDIEVLKVREGEGGTLRLAFKDMKTSENARAILDGLGFEVRHR